jgi:8-oxo-dGTP pyrophosphatase MutT (NUDIX family)
MKKKDMLKKWKTLSTREIFKSKIFSLKEDVVESPRAGSTHPVWYLDVPHWVNIIPVTVDNNVVLVNQYRFGNKDMSLEIPGGMVDPGEDPKEAAIRELYEETGYESSNVIEIGKVLPNPALMANYTFTYLALESTKTGMQQLDGMEDIEITEVPLEKIPSYIDEAKIEHSLVISAFYFLDRYNANNV